jgi:hypothetical protein
MRSYIRKSVSEDHRKSQKISLKITEDQGSNLTHDAHPFLSTDIEDLTTHESRSKTQ